MVTESGDWWQTPKIGNKWWKREKPYSPQNHVKWLISWGILKRSTIIWSRLQARIIFSHLSKNDSILPTFLPYFTKYYKFWNSKMLAIEKCKKISWEYWNFRTLSEKDGVYFDWNVVTPLVISLKITLISNETKSSLFINIWL